MTEAGAGLDTDRLESYLAAELGVEVTDIEVLGDGLNLVLEISTAGDQGSFVLRRPNKPRDTEYLADLEREYGVMRRLRDTPIPTPEPVLFCDAESVLGDRFFLMTRADGDVVPLYSELPDRFRDERSRARVAKLLIETMSDLHSVAVEPFEAVCRRETPREQVERNVDRIDEAMAVTGVELGELRSLGEALHERAPTEIEPTLVHGDFRPGNVLLGGTDRPEVTGVIDWETAHLGDPASDLGYLLFQWRDEGDPSPSVDAIAAEYPDADAIDHLREIDERGFAPHTGRPGSPSRRDLVERYERRTGRRFDNERFYRAHGAFGLATVWTDFYRHDVAAGRQSGLEPYVDYVTRFAKRIVDGELPL